MAGINQLPTTSRFNIQTTRPPEAKQQPTQTGPAAQEQALTYFDLVNIADDLSAVAAQLRRRNDVEKKSSNSSDPFDRILEDEAESKVEQLLLITQTPELTAQDLLLQARALFPDDSDLILVLREIIKRRKLRNENTDALEEVMQQVWAESDEKLCKAGINVGFKAQIFAKKMEVTPWSLRDTYREFLSSGDGEISQYEHWVEQYGNLRRYLVAEFIETALIHDIQSHDPSCSRLEFGALLNHVVNFKKVLSSDKEFMKIFIKGSKRRNDGKGKKQQQGNQQQSDQEKEGQQNNNEQAVPEAEALACWFDCLQRPFKIQKEIEKNNLSQLAARFNLSKLELQQKLLKAIKLLDGDLFFDAEAKQILVETLINFNVKPNSP